MTRPESTREINLRVTLDDNKLPESIVWSATDGTPDPKPCKAFLLSLWDEEDASSLRIDLWTKEMRIDEMSRFFHQTLATMADTYQRATNEVKLAETIREFARTFGKQVGAIS